MKSRWQPVRARLADGRWHFQNGPIDLILSAEGDADACEHAHEQCWQAFQPVLSGLVAELSELRAPLGPQDEGLLRFRGPVARRMALACLPHARAGQFITPMAAVAGSVADHLIGHYRRPGVTRAYINNGGDIALHLAAGESLRAGVVGNAHAPSLDADLDIDGDSPWRGLATSGWRGRSQSLGIADSVTVLAIDAATADAAATIIANHVNVEDPAVTRRPACEVRDDSDLGERLVTVAVGALSITSIEAALAAGRACAQALLADGVIAHAMLCLAGRWMHAGNSLAPDGLIAGCGPAHTSGLARWHAVAEPVFVPTQ